MPSLINTLFVLFVSISSLVHAQQDWTPTAQQTWTPTSQVASPSGYTNYSLTHGGDPNAVVYNTTYTHANATLYPEPDVFLNASVSVEEISIIVDDISAKVNLDAQVLNLLKFNAGVDASIERVSLVIKQVNAEVMLEARLGNIVLMVEDILKSLDLNPILATLGQGLDHIVNHTVGTLTAPHAPASGSSGSSGSASKPPRKRADLSWEMEHNILYSINDYSGHTHTNRVLEQNGNIVDQSLNDDGHVYGTKQVGSYLTEMSFGGHTMEVTRNGQQLTEKEYIYSPFVGLNVYSMIYFAADGSVQAAQVIGETSGGAGSTIAD